jgi:hypothetical protein
MIEWRIIPIFPEYEASSDGEIRRIGSDVVLRPAPNRKTAYLGVSLWRDGKGKTFLVNRLVCSAFHGAPPTVDHQAAHENGIRSDNRADNLSWKTRPENYEDQIRHGTCKRHGRIHSARLTPEQAIEIRNLRAAAPRSSGTGVRIRKGYAEEVAAGYGVTAAAVRQIWKGKTWWYL